MATSSPLDEFGFNAETQRRGELNNLLFCASASLHFNSIAWLACGHFLVRRLRVGHRIEVWFGHRTTRVDRKSTRLNSSHPSISYAVFCLKKKKIIGLIVTFRDREVSDIHPLDPALVPLESRQ